MRAVIAHPDPTVSGGARRALEGAGWEISVATGTDAIREACERGDVDVAFVHQDMAATPDGLIAGLKRRPESFATAIVVIADRVATGVAETLDALALGAHDVLLTPFTDAEVVARASSAARSRALVEELLERDERIETLVFVDELTGLYNRRYLLHQLGMLVAAARRHGHPLACILLDVDRFKSINDTYGHPAGDEVLRSIARSVQERLRTEDVAGRLGGDEFLLLLPETDAAGARTVAEGIRRHLSHASIRSGPRRLRATVSAGWVSWSGEDPAELLQRVDQALYAAKAAGRDRIAAA